MYEVLERAQPGDVLSRVVDISILLLIALSTVALMIETLPSVSDRWGDELDTFNTVAMIVFTVEYLLRIWSFAEADGPGRKFRKRLGYIVSPMALVDLAAILPLFLAALPINTLFLRALRLMRVFRILKIGRYSNSIGTMLRVFRRKRNDLLISFFVIALLLILFANIMYTVETEAQPGIFTNAFQAMWWGIVTITGVGYGDIYPITTAGKLLGGAIAILGIVTVAIPIGILGSAYVEDSASKRKGRIKTIRTSDHVIVCGYNRITGDVISDLMEEGTIPRVVLVTTKPNPEISGVVYVHADWSDMHVLERLSIDKVRSCIIMAERSETPGHEVDPGLADMRTLFTLYKIKTTYPDVHTVVEINDPSRLEMIESGVRADEVILKESIDGNLVASCLKVSGISRLIYELINLEGKVLHETSVRSLGLGENPQYSEVVRHGIENRMTFLGLVRVADSTSQLSPPGATVVLSDDRLIYIADRERHR